MAAETKSTTRKINSWSIKNKGDTTLQLLQYDLGELQEDEVDVKIIASGICMSDIDASSGHYPESSYPYPICPGHEGVGTVIAIGAKVKNVKIGTTVGLGVYRDCCNACNDCCSGRNNLCEKKDMMFLHKNKGTFSDFVRIKAIFAFPIPEGFKDPEVVAPLMCAGLTTFAPFVNYSIRPGQKVAIFGIGGLGHLAVQFARAHGCQVYALSGSADKKDSILKLGAHHFVDIKKDPDLTSVANTFDYVLVTSSGAEVKWKALMNALCPNGKLVLMGNPGVADIPISAFSLIMGQKTIAGSAAGSSGVAFQMLQFAALHNITPLCEKFAFSKINEVMKKVKNNEVRFRAVLCHSMK